MGAQAQWQCSMSDEKPTLLWIFPIPWILDMNDTRRCSAASLLHYTELIKSVANDYIWKNILFLSTNIPPIAIYYQKPALLFFHVSPRVIFSRLLLPSKSNLEQSMLL